MHVGAVDGHAALCGTHRAWQHGVQIGPHAAMARVQRCSLAVTRPHLAGLLVSCPARCCAPQPHRATRSKELIARRLGRQTSGKQEVLRQPASQPARPPQYLVFQLLVPDTQPLLLALPCLSRRCAVRHHRDFIPGALACFLRKRAATSLIPPIPPSATTHNHSTIPSRDLLRSPPDSPAETSIAQHDCPSSLPYAITIPSLPGSPTPRPRRL
jgi:hypothetical protein